MAKRIRVSSDGSTYYTLPGNTGELKNDSGALDDTIFGQDYQSNQPSINSWTITANGLYKGFAGYVATIKKSGTTTAFTAQATTLVSGKTYQISDATKNLWDTSVVPTVKIAGSAVDPADIASIDYLFGQVTFADAYTPASAPTIDGSYFPLAAVGCTNAYTLTQKANARDVTCMPDAQTNGGNRVYDYGLKTVQLELKGIYNASDGFLAMLQARDTVLIEVNPDGAGKSVARGFFKPTSTDQSGKVGDVEDTTYAFNLFVPDIDNLASPFSWAHTSDTTLNQGVIECLNSWETGDTINVQYLPDGTNGFDGLAVLTDLSLSGGLDAMNEFNVSFQGSGTLSAYP